MKKLIFFCLASVSGITVNARTADDFLASTKNKANLFLNPKIAKSSKIKKLSSLKKKAVAKKNLRNNKRSLKVTSDKDNADYIRIYLQGVALYVWDQDTKNGTKYLKGNAFKLLKPDTVSANSAKSGGKGRFQRNFQPLLNLSSQSTGLVGATGSSTILSNVVSNVSTVTTPKYSALTNLLSSDTFGSNSSSVTNNFTNPFDTLGGSMFGSGGLLAPGGLGGMPDPASLPLLLNIAA